MYQAPPLLHSEKIEDSKQWRDTKSVQLVRTLFLLRTVHVTPLWTQGYTLTVVLGGLRLVLTCTTYTSLEWTKLIS